MEDEMIVQITLTASVLAALVIMVHRWSRGQTKDAGEALEKWKRNKPSRVAKA